MNGARGPVEDFALANQALRFRLRNPARVGQLRRNVFVTIELRERRFVTYGHEDLFLPFFRLFRGCKQPHALAGSRQLAIVTIEIL